MSTDPTPPSELAEAAAHRFELEAELAAAREEIRRLQVDLRREQIVSAHRQRLSEAARLVAQYAGHDAAAKALTAARAFTPTGTETWRGHLKALAEERAAVARALRPQIDAQLGTSNGEPK